MEYTIAAVCWAAFVVNQVNHILWAASRVPFVLVSHCLPVLGSNMGQDKQPISLISLGSLIGEQGTSD